MHWGSDSKRDSKYLIAGDAVRCLSPLVRLVGERKGHIPQAATSVTGRYCWYATTVGIDF
jgi:hypothetical protein